MLASSIFISYYKIIKSEEFKIKPIKQIKFEELSNALEEMYNCE